MAPSPRPDEAAAAANKGVTSLDKGYGDSSFVGVIESVLQLPSKPDCTQEYSLGDVRQHRTKETGIWLAISGRVYDITTFVDRHPGGRVIETAYGRDATVLFETHHNLVENPTNVARSLQKYQIGVIKDYQPIARYNTNFAKTLLKRAQAVLKGRPRRDSFYASSSIVFFYFLFFSLVAGLFMTGSLWLSVALGVVMSVGHLVGHAGNHSSLSSRDWVNKFTSMTCTSLWGLREKYWEFSHLISHHCYNYTDNDYILEQHVPLKYCRVRDSVAWTPIHTYQHFLYLTTPITSFFIGAIRLDCFPFILLYPFLSGLRRNHDSPAPAPQFFASGSNVEESKLTEKEDGVGPEHFFVFDTYTDNVISLVLSNIVWLPLFVHTYMTHGLLRALLVNAVAFGTQAAVITQSLLTQHLCEDIKLQAKYDSNSDWYAMQVEASTSILKIPFIMWVTHVISFQTEHHMFPCLGPKQLMEVQPIVEQTCKEFNVQYNFFPSNKAAVVSVFKQFKKLSVKPVMK